MLSIPGSAVRPNRHWHGGVRKRRVDDTGQRQAAQDPRCLGGLPREKVGVLNWRQRRDEQMYAGAAFRRVQAQAGTGVSVIGNLGAVSRLDSVVGLARHYHGETARHQQ